MLLAKAVEAQLAEDRARIAFVLARSPGMLGKATPEIDPHFAVDITSGPPK